MARIWGRVCVEVKMADEVVRVEGSGVDILTVDAVRVEGTIASIRALIVLGDKCACREARLVGGMVDVGRPLGHRKLDVEAAFVAFTWGNRGYTCLPFLLAESLMGLE